MELIKCIDPNEGEALKRGREGGKGRGRGVAENFTWGAELIKCIDPCHVCHGCLFTRGTDPVA